MVVVANHPTVTVTDSHHSWRSRFFRSRHLKRDQRAHSRVKARRAAGERPDEFRRPTPHVCGHGSELSLDRRAQEFERLSKDLAVSHLLRVLFYRPVICSSFSGYRAPCTVIFEAALSISRRSSPVSSMATAPIFSSSRCSLVVPGIGTIHGFWAS